MKFLFANWNNSFSKFDICIYIYIKYLAVTFNPPPFSNKVLSPSGLLVQLNTMETSIPVQTPLYFQAVIFKYPLAFFSV